MKKELVVKVNQYLADVAVSYIKMHNLHWNIVGTQFKAVHEYLEGIYDAYADTLDAVAEILRMHGELPLASLKDYLAVTRIQELESKEIAIPEAVQITVKDIRLLREAAADIRKDADEEDLFGLVSEMEDNITAFDKHLWFLGATLK